MKFTCIFCHLLILTKSFFFIYFMDTTRVLNSLKSDLGPKSFVNPYKPSILLVGHRQTMQNQIRCSLSDQVLHCLKTERIIHLIVHKGLKFIICHNFMQYCQTFTVIECCIQKVPPPPLPLNRPCLFEDRFQFLQI